MKRYARGFKVEMKDTDRISWRRIGQTAVLRAWAIAEATSTKNQLGQQIAVLAPAASRKIQARELDRLTENDWQTLEQAIVKVRAFLLKTLIALEPEWYEGNIGFEALAAMRFFDLPDWTSKTPSRIFGDFCGERHLPGREPEFRGFRTSIECPIAVAPALDGPLCLIEGYTRCATILRDHRAGLSTIQEVPIILGVTSRITTAWTNGRNHRWW